jgi:signal transduction histidine kinase
LPGLSQDAELALFRAMQESLSNIMRHAAARQVRVRLESDGSVVRLEVRDDGRGLDGSDRLARAEREGRMGMAGMRERVVALGGQLAVELAQPTGTVVRVVLPMEAST